MYTLLAIIIVLASVLLTIAVLLQNSKGGGLASNFISGNQMFGVRETANKLERATWFLSLTVIVLCILATAFISTGAKSSDTELLEQIENAAPVGQPQFPVTPNDTL